MSEKPPDFATSASAFDYLRKVQKYRLYLQDKRDGLESDVLYGETVAKSPNASLIATVVDRQSTSNAQFDELNTEATTAVAKFRRNDAMEVVYTKLEELEHSERMIAYAKCVSRISEIDSKLRLACLDNDWVVVTREYEALSTINRQLECSACRELSVYIERVHEAWTSKLLNYAEQQLVHLLDTIHYPFEHLTSVDATNFENTQRLTAIVDCLYTLEVQRHSSWDYADWSVVKAFTKPFLRKFDFHFNGTLRTNDRAHPQWYFTQTHIPYISVHVDQLLACHVEGDTGRSPMQINSILVEQLIGCCSRKTLKLARELCGDDDDVALFTHLIDEAAVAQMQFNCLLPTPPRTQIMNVLCSDTHVLQLWLDIERHCVTSRCEELLNIDGEWDAKEGMEVPSAWRPRYQLDDVADEYMVPQCCDTYVMLLRTCSERFRLVTNRLALTHYACMQLAMLDDFRTRLLQMYRQCQSPWSTVYSCIMNAIRYLIVVQEEWNIEPFYVKLQYAKQQATRRARGDNEESLNASVKLDADSSKDYDVIIRTGLFDHMVQLYGHIWQQMCDDMINRFVDGECVRAAHKYKHAEQWYNVPSATAVVGGGNSNVQRTTTVTNSLCPMLLTVRARLAHIDAHIAPMNRAKILSQCGDSIAEMFYIHIICESQFSQTGAEQMLYDVTQALLPLLHSFEACSMESLTPSMARCIEALKVLAMNRATVMLMYDSIDRQQGVDEICVTLMADMEVYHLTRAEVMALLERRVDVVKRAASPL